MNPDVNRNLIAANNEMSILERVPIVELPTNSVQCTTCFRVLSRTELKNAGFICIDCNDRVCATCGCTDSVACEGGCTWIQSGVCSTHDEESIRRR